ncbi:hypothetical protein [Flavobacterium sp.]|uniref:hypothetical protein n=1 Tax=Flavobacterium sp. TaxID=239 RepID=UPI004033FD34
MPTNDLTYTVTGKFTTSMIELGAHLPALKNDTYTFHEVHDITHKDGNGTVTNALLIHMKRDSGDDDPLSWNGTDADVAVPIITPSTPKTVHADSPGFNWNAADALIFIFHEPFDQAIVDDMQKKVRTKYNEVKLIGPFSATWSNKNVMDTEDWDNPIVKPRKAGMTIISKL